VSADIVPLPVEFEYPKGRQGPAGAVIDDLTEQEEILEDQLVNYPYRSEFDPSATVKRLSLIELRLAVWLLTAANKLIDRADSREAQWRLEES
jgi:hypothetical protein